MKYAQFLSVLLLISSLIFSCDNNNPIDPPIKTPLKFDKLVASDTNIKIDDFATITATASGDELIYTWESDLGTFIGSGSQVMWAGCHADTFEVKCTVSDKYKDKKTKSIFFYVN